MPGIVVEGGRTLQGSIRVYGAKNAILPILAASIMTDQNVVLRGCPMLSDVDNMLKILRLIGCEAEQYGDEIHICAKNATSHEMPCELSKEIRSSIFMLGPLLARFQRAWVTYPGGCEIGLRPIELHLKGLRELNATVVEEGGEIHCWGDHMRGAEISLDYPSVGATENIMMAAARTRGKTIIRNAAREPEIIDLAAFINAMGGKVYGAGDATIEIIGVDKLNGCTFTIMPDRIVAGTYMVAAAITGGDVTVEGVCPDHMKAVLAKLREAGSLVLEKTNSIRVISPARPREIRKIETLPFPGFPTDMQAQFFALATVANGTSVIVENVFENRFKHAAELMKMGASIQVKDRTAIIRGVETLHGAAVEAKDLRCGAALVLAGLRASGKTTVSGTHYIDRGYQDLSYELASLGADIRKAD